MKLNITVIKFKNNRKSCPISPHFSRFRAIIETSLRMIANLNKAKNKQKPASPLFMRVAGLSNKILLDSNIFLLDSNGFLLDYFLDKIKCFLMTFCMFDKNQYQKLLMKQKRVPACSCIRCGWGHHPITGNLIVSGLKVMSYKKGKQVVLCGNCYQELKNDPKNLNKKISIEMPKIKQNLSKELGF